MAGVRPRTICRSKLKKWMKHEKLHIKFGLKNHVFKNSNQLKFVSFLNTWIKMAWKRINIQSEFFELQWRKSTNKIWKFWSGRNIGITIKLRSIYSCAALKKIVLKYCLNFFEFCSVYSPHYAKNYIGNISWLIICSAIWNFLHAFSRTENYCLVICDE